MKYPMLGRERRRPIALSAVGTVLVLAFACVLFTLTVLAIQPGLLSDTLAAFWEDKLLIPLNIFPVCVVLIVCYCLTGNAFSAAGIGGLVVNLLSYINLVKTDCPQRPLRPGGLCTAPGGCECGGGLSAGSPLGYSGCNSAAERSMFCVGLLVTGT